MDKLRFSAMILAIAIVASIGSVSQAVAVPLVKAQLIATLSQPVAMAVRTGDPALYIAEQGGRVRAIVGGVVQPGSVLDLTGVVSCCGERGLLGIAFTPDGSKLYTSFTDLNGDSRIAEFAFAAGIALPASRRDVLFLGQPFSNHNGGNIIFGPDGYLYIGFGDGGSGGDPFGNGQNLATLLGKMLRIDPLHGVPYSVPATNPFFNRLPALPEIWAYGLRNPWRWSFDKMTGDLWIADVGQNMWEEIDYQRGNAGGGQNYGWNRMEGLHPYNGGTAPPNHVPPVYEYGHTGGNCSVTGGYVYRGTAIPSMFGSYLFADFCAGRVQALLRTAAINVGTDLGVAVANPSSFGQDAAGELYVLSIGGGIYKLVPLV